MHYRVYGSITQMHTIDLGYIEKAWAGNIEQAPYGFTPDGSYGFRTNYSDFSIAAKLHTHKHKCLFLWGDIITGVKNERFNSTTHLIYGCSKFYNDALDVFHQNSCRKSPRS